MSVTFLTLLSLFSLLFCNGNSKVVFITEDTSTSLTNGFGKEFHLNRGPFNDLSKDLDINKLWTVTQNQHKNILINDEDVQPILFPIGASVEEILDQEIAKNKMNAVFLNYLQEINLNEYQELLGIAEKINLEKYGIPTPRVIY